MQRKTVFLIFAVLFAGFFLAGCATIDVEYEGDYFDFGGKGDISLIMSRSVPRLTVLVDNRIVLDGRHADTRRVDILGVPEGSHRIVMFADSWKLKENFHFETDVRVRRGETEVVTALVPQYSPMYWIYIIGMAIASSLPPVVVRY